MSLFESLNRGYFPKELPNPFVTTSFATAVTSSGISLPSKLLPNWAVRQASDTTLAAKYSLCRNGLLRRHLSIPNPINQFQIARELEINWTTLKPHIKGTKLSATHPVFSPTGRAIQGAHPLADRPLLSINSRLNKHYILQTDISRFYQSIYTHSIPWALHGKLFAKNHRELAHLGNKLDFLIRSGQDGQTVGIPIGPDTSLVIAEILMQECDKKLLSSFRKLKGNRWIDDYEIGFNNRTDAQAAYHILGSILAEFELALNPKKTLIIDLPAPIEPSWVLLLRRFRFRSSQAGQYQDLMEFFSTAYELSKTHPDYGILQYAVGRTRTIPILAQNWSSYCHLLLNCAVPEPACLPYVLEIIINGINKGFSNKIKDLESILNDMIVDHSPTNDTSEVAWALWGCLALGLTIHKKAANAVINCDNSFIALLTLHANSIGLVKGGLNPVLWAGYMTTKALREENWLLAYEAKIKGWLPSLGGGNHLTADPVFNFLSSSKVSFYDITGAVRSGAAAPLPVPNVPMRIQLDTTLPHYS